MSDVVQMQMKRDNSAVNDTNIPSIDDILSKNKKINNSEKDINDKTKVDKDEIIKNNEIKNKDNEGQVNYIQIKKSRLYIISIIINAFLGIIVLFDFINFLISPNVRINLI